MRSIFSSLSSMAFHQPYWNPPPNLGVQFVAFGEGGPSGNPAFKASTAIPWPLMQTMSIAPSVTIGPRNFLFGIHPIPPQGVATSRPVNPYNNAISTPGDYARIMGLVKE